ncbi:unnamed protein product [Trichobilharzia szidati]|nr:unnamed protein product [Trichobilharzia szidati]
MKRKDLERLLSGSTNTEPVINLKSSNSNIHERSTDKRYRHHQNTGSTTHDVSDRMNAEVKHGRVNESKGNENSKYHRKNLHNIENLSADINPTSNFNPSLHEPEAYSHRTSNLSTWIPNLGHPYFVPSRSKSEQILPQPNFQVKRDKSDQYLSDDSQDNRLYSSNIVSPIQCSPRVNKHYDDHQMFNPCMVKPELLDEEQCRVYQPNINMNSYEPFENQVNAQLARLSMLHAQQLNIQVLLEQEWMKLHKVCELFTCMHFDHFRKFEN